MQLPRAGTNRQIIVRASEQRPLLRSHIPKTEISSTKLEFKALGLTRREQNLVKSTQLSHRLPVTWNCYIELADLGSLHVTGVGNISRHSGYSVPEILVATGNDTAAGDFRQAR